MAREDVNIKVSADVAEAIRMWRAMQEGPKAMADELEATGRKGKRAQDSLSSSASKVVGHWLSIGAAIASAKKTLDFYMAAEKEALERTGASTRPVDSLFRSFTVQGGLTNKQAEVARKQILQTGLQRKATPQVAFSAAEQLVSSGFSADEVTSGGGLNEFLKLLSSTNASRPDVDARGLAKNTALFLESIGKEKTAGNLRDTSLQIQGLFKGTNIQTGDLGLFAKEAGKINQQFPELGGDQLALLSQFEGVADVATAGTALRKALVAIRTAKATPKKLRALESIGVDFSEVDNESFAQVQNTLTKGFGGVDPVTANIAAKNLFGEEALLARSVLFSPEGQRLTRERRAIGGNSAAFERDVAISEGSLAAQSRAAETREALAFFDKGFIDPGTARRNLITELKSRGFSAAEQKQAGAFFDSRLEGLLSIGPGGGTVEAAVNEGVGIAGGTSDIVQKVLQQSRSSTPSDLKVTVEITDQDAVAIPHKAAVSQLNTAE